MKKKIVKQDRQHRVLELEKKKMILCHAGFFGGILLVLIALFLPGRLADLSGWLIAIGIVGAMICVFIRDYYFRCPACGQTLMKKQSIKNKIKGVAPSNCPKCGWHKNIIYK